MEVLLCRRHCAPGWGEPRLTRDIDLTLVTGFGGKEPFVNALCEAFAARIPDAGEFAMRNRVLLLQSARL